jgi:hypothetical protein
MAEESGRNGDALGAALSDHRATKLVEQIRSDERQKSGESIGRHLVNGDVDAAYAAAKRWAGS